MMLPTREAVSAGLHNGCFAPPVVSRAVHGMSRLIHCDMLPSLRPSYASVSRTAVRARSVLDQPRTVDANKNISSVTTKLSGAAGEVVQLYRYPGLSASKAHTLLRKANTKVSDAITSIDGELCYNVALTEPLNEKEAETLAWLLRETFEPQLLTSGSQLAAAHPSSTIIEVGPRTAFQTALSTNAVSICRSAGIAKVTRLELSRRYLVSASRALTEAECHAFAGLVHDRMTEEVYAAPAASFRAKAAPPGVFTVPVMQEGRAALERINSEMGLAYDDWDMEYYTALFRDDMKRDPTNVELFDIAQSNSEHSRHWFFRGDIEIDGVKMPHNLFDIVKTPWKANPNNSVVAFKDNSSAIRGTQVMPLLPAQPGAPSPLVPQPRDWDLLLTAETHNFPCAVAPYPGAETGAGGRMRDTHATGTGSIMGAGTAGYCTGNLRLEGNSLPHEQEASVVGFQYPPSLATPQQILIDASNGASDYGNKFGEPLIAGYTRTFGQRLPNGERREWIKPIMFSGGVGQIDHRHLDKAAPEISMLVVKIGGPAYRIGMGGGAASSVPSGGNRADLDFNAVQRGDAEYSQKLWRVVRSCVELGDKNPIVQIHDQGAGGNCNVVKEIIYPLGAEIDVRAVKVGDETLSVLEIWGAEYQENDAILIKPEHRDLLQSICDRERCFMQVIGSIDGSGRVRLVDKAAPAGSPMPVDLDLEKVLGSMPNKTFKFTRALATANSLQPLRLPAGESAQSALHRVLRLPSVCSKRFLTTKVDRHVTGLVAQQQTVGALQLPLSDVAVYAQTHQGHTGLATSIGEQPLKGMISPPAMARLSLGEALTNLVWAAATSLPDVRASVNWMYAAKMKAEGAAMYDAAIAISDAMMELGVACDGGKDSLSMAALADGESVMAPGNLVVSAYVGCPDITKVVTPDLKMPGSGVLLHVDLAAGRRRLGGSALAQAYNQIGDNSPDVTAAALKGMWEVVQKHVKAGTILAGHDISDGGIATALLEMAFAGNVGVEADLPTPQHDEGGVFAALFAEELGLLIEASPSNVDALLADFKGASVTASRIGKTVLNKQCSITVAGASGVAGSTTELRDIWEETSFALDRLQAAEEAVDAEQRGLKDRKTPVWKLPYTPMFTAQDKLTAADKVRVAIVREEGSNGDREMAAACYAAGLEPWDITMSDLLNGRAMLDTFQGLVFVGGFSYADVLDSAKGWAGTIRFNERVLAQFEQFYARSDTFSLGICNGCQLMALLGWVPTTAGQPTRLPDLQQPRFVHNASGRFESRWVQVQVAEGSPAVMLKGMGGASIGVWCAHGEGQALFPDDAVRAHVLEKNLAPVRYVDDDGVQTEAYPFNPNGSPLGIAALCSEDGRHLAMMPHPERSFLTWQQPWYPPDLGLDPKGPAPWLKLFQNAREWAEANPKV